VKRRLLLPTVLAAAGLLAACSSSSSHPSSTTTPASDSAGSSVSSGSSGPTSSSAASTAVSLPSNVPSPAGLTQGPAQKNRNGGGVIVTFPNTSPAAAKAYRTQLVNDGWTQTTASQDKSGGTYQFTKGNSFLGVGYSKAAKLLTVSTGGS